MTMAQSDWLFRGSPSLLLMLDESLECHCMSNAWLGRLDPHVAQKSSIPAAELFDFDSDPELLAKFKHVIRDGVPIANAAVGLILSAGILPCRFGAWRAQPENNGQSFLVIAATDVSKYHDAMTELAELQTQHSLILDAAGEGIYGLDANGCLTFGNAMAETILGWDTQKTIGHKAHDVHHHSHTDGSPYPRNECPVYAALTDGEIHHIDDEVFWHADGHAVPVDYTSTPILEDGKPRGAVVIFRDVSERRELERQRSAAFDEVKQLKEQLEQERDYLREEINVSSNFGEIIGESQALKRTLAQIEAVAPTPANVLVLGESGVGKEMIARAIHQRSDRAQGPLVKVNCASIPKELFESEFFGHVKGAFTGAHRDRVGRLHLADTGTLFLDEIGEIPLS